MSDTTQGNDAAWKTTWSVDEHGKPILNLLGWGWVTVQKAQELWEERGATLVRLDRELAAAKHAATNELLVWRFAPGSLPDVLTALASSGLLDRLEGLEVSSTGVKLSLRPGVQRIIDPPPAPVETTPYNPHSRPPETMEELAAVVGIKLPERP